jgi:hypothetical protein
MAPAKPAIPLTAITIATSTCPPDIVRSSRLEVYHAVETKRDTSKAVFLLMLPGALAAREDPPRGEARVGWFAKERQP